MYKAKAFLTTNGSVDPLLTVATNVNSTYSEPHVRKSKRLPKTHLNTNAWRLIDSEFDSLNAIFSFTLEACCDLDGSNRHGSLPLYSKKDSFMSHYISRQSVYCNLPLSLAIKYVKHIRTCHSKSPMNTTVVIVFLYWPQFNATTTVFILLRQVQTIDTHYMTLPLPIQEITGR